MTELIIRNARLANGSQVDIAADAGVITAVGPTLDGNAVTEVDAEGRTAIPGLWDEHVHTNLWSISRRRLDLSGVTSAADAISRVAEGLNDSPDDVVVAVNYRDALWADRLSVAALDAVSGERPVLLISGDVHGCWLNSAALRRFNVSVHDDGRIAEDDAFRVQKLAHQIPDPTIDDWVTQSLADAASRGVVGIVDLEMRDTASDWVRRSASGRLRQRVEACVYREHLDSAIDDGRSTGRVLDHRGLVRAGYFKCITDGSLGTRTAWCSHAYPDGSHGAANVDYRELEVVMARAHQAGIVSTIHAIGDLAVHEVLNVFERLGTGGRMEHAQQVMRGDLPRFAALGVLPSVQPEHAMDDRDTAEALWADALDGAYLLRSFIDAGSRLAFGSDAPVAPLDPWHAIASAVHRTRGDRDPWRAEEAVTLQQALSASSRYRELRPGEPADVVLLDADPSALTPAELRGMPVAATMVAGELIFDNGVELR